MDEKILRIFVRGTAKYFEQVGRQPVEVNTPYLKDPSEMVMLDFSSVIGITGGYRGCIYYTTPREMAQKLIQYSGESETGDDLCADCVGEIANTISGNAREQLGSGFMISVPVIFKGSADSIVFPKNSPTFVIPILWQSIKSYLLICVAPSSADPLLVN